MQMTHSLVSVAIALLSEPDGQHWGYDLSRQTGVRSGVLYPILSRLLDRGWLEDGWEDPAAITDKRPPRRYYTVTTAGLEELGAISKRAEADRRFTSFRPQVAM